VSRVFDVIRTEAALKLAVAPESHVRDALPRFKEFLPWANRRLREWHEEGAGGRELCTACSGALDLFLASVLAGIPLGNGSPARLPRLAVVAHGGYGREELSPCSDVDLLFLHDGTLKKGVRDHPWVQCVAGEGLLWDLGLESNPLCFSIDEAIRHANQDMVSKTAFLETRLLAGDRGLFSEFSKVLADKCVHGHENEYIEMRLQDQIDRRSKFGNSACMVEPNLKNGCGGLRDYQNLLWMARFRYGARSLEALESQKHITAEEREALHAAHDFLLRVRNELHFRYAKRIDVLHKSFQPSVATGLGYSSRSPSGRLEEFMGDLYAHMRNVYLTTKTVERRLALLPQPKRLPTFKQFLQQRKERAQYPVDGFKFIDGEVYPEHEQVIQADPRRLMRLFLHAQSRQVVLHPHTVQLVKQSLGLVDREFLKDEHVRTTFLEILGYRGQVGRVLHEMHEAGLLGRYLPEFGRLTCKVQHEFFHQYAVDEHTLVCLEKLDELWNDQQCSDQRYLEVFRGLDAPHVLSLALLLHDAGKAEKGERHEISGVKIAARVARRLQLDPAAEENLLFLVEHHLLMAQVSQKRDLDDPAEIQEFAQRVGSMDQLRMLLLLTRSDSLGTNNQMWNGFKDSLIWTLYTRAAELLLEQTHRISTQQVLEQHLSQEVRRLGRGVVEAEDVDAHFQGMPSRYFRVFEAPTILGDIRMVREFKESRLREGSGNSKPVVRWHDDVDRGFTEARICTWDRAGLFSRLTGSLSASGLSILGAQVFTRNDGIAIDTFYVQESGKNPYASPARRSGFEENLEKLFAGRLDLDAEVRQAIRAEAVPAWIEVRELAVEVKLDNRASSKRTAIEVIAPDRSGLLYVISKTLAKLQLDLQLAKICTENGAVTDVFYAVEGVGEHAGLPVTGESRVQQICRTLQSEIEAWFERGKQPF